MFLIKGLAGDFRLCMARLELDAKEFERKLMSFIPALHEVREQNSPARDRKFGVGQKGTLPKRRISSMKEFFEDFSCVKDIFVDGNEQ